MNPLDDPIPDLPPESEWKAELEDLTDRFDEPTASVPFRETLREELGREVARHGHHRQWRRIAAALAIFVAGWAAGSFFDRGTPSEAPNHIAESSSSPNAEPPTPSAPELPVDPKELDRALAKVEPALRPERLARAGDAYLDGEQANPSAALYFYQQALDAIPDAPAVELDDSWLLKALKADRQED